MKDNLAVMCSGLCLVHCVVTPILLLMGMMTTATTWLEAEWVHQLLFVPVVILAVLSLPASFKQHRNYYPIGLAAIGLSLFTSAFFLPEQYEYWLTIPAAWLLISAHLWNRALLLKHPLQLEPVNG